MPPSIFQDGKLKPGTYKIQNLHNDAYLDIHEHSAREVHLRPTQDLGEGKGLWEIKPLGAGYMVEPGKPERFCAPMDSVGNGCTLYATAYPVAWRIEIVDDDAHRGFEYVRFYWGTTEMLWDPAGSDKDPNTKIVLWTGEGAYAWCMWRLIPVEVDNVEVETQPGSHPLVINIQGSTVTISAR